MATTASELRRQAIRSALTRRVAGAADASAAAEAGFGLWQQLSKRLVSVIGARGVDALFSRALHLVGGRFAQVALIAQSAGDAPLSPADLWARLASGETRAVMETNCALLETFTELLATLIGDSLTERLLGPVWMPPPAAADQESPS